MKLNGELLNACEASITGGTQNLNLGTFNIHLDEVATRPAKS